MEKTFFTVTPVTMSCNGFIYTAGLLLADRSFYIKLPKHVHPHAGSDSSTQLLPELPGSTSSALLAGQKVYLGNILAVRGTSADDRRCGFACTHVPQAFELEADVFV